MLDGLDAIDWSALEHAYGPATDVPGQLRALTGPDPAARQRALWDLSGNIVHQGTVFEASAHAVPFVARIAQGAPDLPDQERAGVVALLAGIAGGSSYLAVHEPLIRGGLSADEREEMARELEHVRAAHDAVAREAGSLYASLGGRSVAIDDQLAILAAHVPEASGAALPVIDAVRARTTDRRRRVALDLVAALIEDRVTADLLDAAAAVDPDLAEAVDAEPALDPAARAQRLASILLDAEASEGIVEGGPYGEAGPTRRSGVGAWIRAVIRRLTGGGPEGRR